MGKPRTKKKKNQPKISKSENDIAVRRAVKKTRRKYGIEQLLDKVDECMEQLDLEGVKMFCERALQINPDHPRALEVTGNLLLEANQPEKAKQCFGRVITLEPDKSPGVYLNLAQLSEGSEAVQLFNKGIELMLMEKESGASAGEEYATKISSAYCSIAEVFMTDLCFEENAETSCKNAVEKAIEFDENNFEAYQAFANFLLSTNKPAESKEMLEKSLSFWLKSEDDKDTQGERETELPPFPLRLAAAKLLIEHKEYKTALRVLEQLAEEDDEELELWYLSGTCYYSLSDHTFTNITGNGATGKECTDSNVSFSNGTTRDAAENGINKTLEYPADSSSSTGTVRHNIGAESGFNDPMGHSETSSENGTAGQNANNSIESANRMDKTLQDSESLRELNRSSAIEHFCRCLELMAKLEIQDQEMYSDIISMVKDLGHTGEEPEFNLKCIKSNVKITASKQMSAMLGAAMGSEPRQSGAQGDGVDSDNESLTLSDKEFLGEFMDSDDDHDDFGDVEGAGTSSTMENHEPMEE